MLKKSLYLSLFILVIFQARTSFSQSSNNFEISKNLDIYATLFKELDANYVDALNVGELSKTAIVSMLKELDPYTVYIPESDIEDFKIMTTGQYGGIGALIHKQNDQIVISEPYENMPAHKFGLKAGDILLEVDKKSMKNKSTDDVSNILKGQPGTHVNVLLKRYNVAEPVEIELTRDNVKIDNIPYYGMVGGKMGYIKLTNFTQEASEEVKAALLKLKSEHFVQGIILDLRGNGGGLLQEAVDITNLFVDRGQLVVSTKGKIPARNKSYLTINPAVDINIPLVVLVDGQSASASEIVAGAIQDLDRGIILGEKTFGKGLVQNVIPLTYNSQVKITVAKYYIPSGRCIQAIDYSKKDENGDVVKTPDSLMHSYTTAHGRKVLDAGGILPDIQTPGRELSDLSVDLITKFMIFDFATRYAATHSTIPPPDEFEISGNDFQEFKNFLSEKNYKYEPASDKTLKKLVENLKEEKTYEQADTYITQLETELQKQKEGLVDLNKDEISELLTVEIVSRYYFFKGKVIASLEHDEDIKKAIEVLENQGMYTSLLSGSGKQGTKQN